MCVDRRQTASGAIFSRVHRWQHPITIVESWSTNAKSPCSLDTMQGPNFR